MAENKKCSAPCILKQVKFEEQDVYDFEKLFQGKYTKAEINSDKTNKDKLVIFILLH